MSVDVEALNEEQLATIPSSPAESEDYASYRAMSTLAVASLVTGILSILALVDWVFGLIPAVGILLALRARRQIRGNPRELAGGSLANAGLLLSIAFLVGGWVLLSAIYMTEVPEGYQRISYAQLQPTSEASSPKSGAAPGTQDSKDIIPASARALDGKKVFVKGYMFPGAHGDNLSTFVLVRDNGVCCFGGSTPKLTDMILVNFEGDLQADYTTRLRKLAGTFKVQAKAFTNPQEQENLGQGKVAGVLYQLEADYLK